MARKSLMLLILLLAAGSRATVCAQQQQSPQAPTPSSDGSPALGFKNIDALLLALSAATVDLQRFIGGRGSQDGPTSAEDSEAVQKDCREHFSLKGMLQGPVPGEMTNSLVDYHMCLAFSRKNPRECASLAQYRAAEQGTIQQEDLVADCKNLAFLNAFLRESIAHTADAPARCKDYLAAQDPPEIIPGNIDKACAILLSSTDARVACSQFEPLMIKPNPINKCVRQIDGVLFGDEKACAGSKEFTGWDMSNCISFGAYRRAQSARDPKLCGGLPLCRMLIGAPDACESYAVELRTAYCRAFVKHPLSTPEDRSAETFNKKRAYADKLLKQLAEALASHTPKGMRAFKVRSDAFAAEREILRKVLNRSPGDAPSRGSVEPSKAGSTTRGISP